jgi:release factor glutamine methyltransferase
LSNYTVGEALAAGRRRLRAAGIDDADLESEALLATAIGIGRSALLARLPDPLADVPWERFARFIERRLGREPLAYIVGHREFYGIKIGCGPGVLIPRPETEMLVEFALGECPDAPKRVADVGTGSGAVAIAVLTHAPAARVTATDSSQEALGVARENADWDGIRERIDFQHCSLLEGQGRFDVIVANLPYVSEAEWLTLAQEVRDHEPHEALVGGLNGTEMIRDLLATAREHLSPGGAIALEIGATQGDELAAAARANFPEAVIRVRKDLAGLDRVLEVRG